MGQLQEKIFAPFLIQFLVKAILWKMSPGKLVLMVMFTMVSQYQRQDSLTL